MFKKILLPAAIVSTMALSPVAHATFSEGPYVTALGGLTNTHYSRNGLNLTSSGSIDNNKSAARLALGYQVKPGFGMELGYSHYDQVTVKNVNGGGNEGEIQNNTIDIVARLSQNIGSKWGVFARVGAAYTKQTLNGTLKNANGYKDDNVWAPTFGVGLVNNISKDINLEFGANRIVHKNKVEDADLAYIGLSWSFAHWDK